VRTFTVTVDDVAPVLDVNPVVGAVAGATTKITGAVIDPGGPDDAEATRDFGDGSGAQTVVRRVNGTFDIGHVYQAAGNYTLTLSAVGAPDEVVAVSVADAPLSALDDSFSVNEDAVLSVTEPLLGVLANDEGATTATLAVGPLHDGVTLNADGTFEYTPNANFSGIDTLTYQVADDGLAAHVGQVDITSTRSMTTCR
jgi:hypothetical protein